MKTKIETQKIIDGFLSNDLKLFRWLISEQPADLENTISAIANSDNFEDIILTVDIHKFQEKYELVKILAGEIYSSNRDKNLPTLFDKYLTRIEEKILFDFFLYGLENPKKKDVNMTPTQVIESARICKRLAKDNSAAIAGIDRALRSYLPNQSRTDKLQIQRFIAHNHLPLAAAVVLTDKSYTPIFARSDRKQLLTLLLARPANTPKILDNQCKIGLNNLNSKKNLADFGSAVIKANTNKLSSVFEKAISKKLV